MKNQATNIEIRNKVEDLFLTIETKRAQIRTIITFNEFSYDKLKELCRDKGRKDKAMVIEWEFTRLNEHIANSFDLIRDLEADIDSTAIEIKKLLREIQ